MQSIGASMFQIESCFREPSYMLIFYIGNYSENINLILISPDLNSAVSTTI